MSRVKILARVVGKPEPGSLERAVARAAAEPYPKRYSNPLPRGRVWIEARPGVFVLEADDARNTQDAGEVAPA